MSATLHGVAQQAVNGVVKVVPYAHVVITEAGTSTVVADVYADGRGNWKAVLAAGGKHDITTTAPTGEVYVQQDVQVTVENPAPTEIEAAAHLARDVVGDQFFTSSPFPGSSPAVVERPRAVAGAVQVLHARLPAALLSGEQLVVELMKNGVATGLLVTLTPSIQEQAVSGVVSFAAGDRWCLRGNRSGPLIAVVGGSTTGVNVLANGNNISVGNLTASGPAACERVAFVVIAAYDANSSSTILEPGAVNYIGVQPMTKLAATELTVGGKTLRLSVWQLRNPTPVAVASSIGTAFAAHPREYCAAAVFLVQGATAIASSGVATAAGGSVGVTLTPPVTSALMVDAVAGVGNVNLVGATGQTEHVETGTTVHLAIGVRHAPSTSPLLSTWTQAGGTQMAMVSAMLPPTAGYVPGIDLAASLQYA